MRFENQTFENQDVTLDENEFIGCSIVDCRLTFYGGRFRIENTQFTGRIAGGVGGNAANTLEFLRLLHGIDPGLVGQLLQLDNKRVELVAPRKAGAP